MDRRSTAPTALTQAPAQARSREAQARICAACPSRAAGFCSRLDDATLADLADRSTRVVMAAEALLQSPDLVVVTGGLLRATHDDPDGRRQILGITTRGEAVLPQESSETVRTEAATQATLCRIHAASYRDVFRRSAAFRQLLHDQVQAKRDRALQLAGAIAALRPEQRIIAFLADCSAFMPWQPLPGGEGGVLTMVFERRDIAALLATSAETVSRVLHGLQDRGDIRLLDPRHFEIADVARLRAQGGLASTDRPALFAPPVAGAPPGPAAAGPAPSAGQP
jgi:CRP/FNR family transcriptional regulator